MNKKTFSLFARRRSIRAVVLLTMAVTATLASCSSEDMTDNPVETLPEGMYRLTFTATQGEVVATPQTRVSEGTDGKSSKWDGGEVIKVAIGAGGLGTATELTCTMQSNGTVSTDKQLYWQNTQPSTVNAWYSNITGQGTMTSNTVSLSDQSSGLAYVLKTDETTPKYNTDNGKIALNFKHKLAKVRVKLEKGTTAADLTSATVKIKGQYTDCSIDKGVVNPGTVKGAITMHKPTTTDGYYEANIVPGTTFATDCFEITTDGKTVSATTTAVNTTTAGQMYTFTITVNKPAVVIIDKNGNSVSTDNINTDVTVTGSGDQTLNITGNVNVMLDNVTIAEGTDAPIKIAENCSPTITIKGDTNLSFSKGEKWVITGGIQLEKGASVTVKGNGNSDDKLTITNENGFGAGIGSAFNSNNNACGNITITDLVAEIKVVKGGAAIGSGVWGSCGNITITNSTLNLSVGDAGAAIGTGALNNDIGEGNCTCAKITITSSNITARAGNYYAAFPSVIGCGGKYSAKDGIAKCGDITITLMPGQTQTQFESQLTSNSGTVAKVGAGGNSGQVGTITYKNN